MNKTIGIYGGAFDPVHIGHLNSAWELTQELPLDTIHFIPSAEPAYQKPVKATPIGSSADRIAMLKLAIEHEPKWQVDDREIKRGGKSYSVDTLLSLRSEFPKARLCLILGMDVASTLHTWHRWQELWKLAHIIVMTRPNYSLPNADWLTELKQRQMSDPNALRTESSGGVWWQPITPLSICSTQIRESCSKNQIPRFLLPEKVIHYIKTKQLYQD